MAQNTGLFQWNLAEPQGLSGGGVPPKRKGSKSTEGGLWPEEQPQHTDLQEPRPGRAGSGKQTFGQASPLPHGQSQPSSGGVALARAEGGDSGQSSALAGPISTSPHWLGSPPTTQTWKEEEAWLVSCNSGSLLLGETLIKFL